MTRDLLEQVFQKTYDPLVAYFADRTGNFETAAGLAEKVLVAAAREQTCRTPQEWTTWCWTTAGRVHNDYLENRGEQP